MDPTRPRTPDTGPRLPSLRIAKARLYNRALTAQEVTAAYAGEEGAQVQSRSIARTSAPELEPYNSTERALATTLGSFDSLRDYRDPGTEIENAQKEYGGRILALQRTRIFHRVPVPDRRYGGVLTN